MDNKKVALLLCDEHYPEAIEQFGLYRDALFALFDDTFEAVGAWQCHLGEFPQTEDELEADIWLISGSKYSVNDCDEWVAQLQQLVQKLYSRNKQMLGICFGHQMLHKALGGTVGQRPDGFAVGLEKVTTDESSPVAICGEALLFMHQEEVTELADGFSSVGNSEHCDNVITSDGKGSLSFQCHPEFSVEFFTLLCERVEFGNKAQIVEQCWQGNSQYKKERQAVIGKLNDYLTGEEK